MLPTLAQLVDLARGAGEILRDGFHNSNHVQHKGVIDLVTEVDHRSEEYLLERIRKQYPDHSIVAEESGEIENHSQHSWYIDPLDGTTNYAHGLPVFSVSIGYMLDGAPQLGVVYNPVREELFSAESGKGAWFNGKPIHTGNQNELENSLLVTGFPYDRFTNPDNNLDFFTRFALQVQGVRRLGSAALDLCYIGAGWIDGYWEIRLEPWDLAAGWLVATEAGAAVTKRDGSTKMLERPCSVVAANPELHAKMLAVLTEVGKQGS